MVEYPFDFQTYIEEKLRTIDDLDERRFTKKLLLEGLGKIILRMEGKYADLEKRIYDEIEIAENQYEIAMTIINRKNYDPTNETLFPIFEEDFDNTELAKKYSTEEELWLGTVFVELPEKEIKEFEKKGSFLGAALLGTEEKVLDFYLKPSIRYRDRVERLYQTFQDNQILWRTVNTAFLSKFYDVFIKDPKTNIERDNYEVSFTLDSSTIYFGKYSDAIRYDIIPLWNIEEIKFRNENFMVPCVDNIYFEHEFITENRRLTDGYLIQSNEDIIEIRHEKDKIVIKSTEENYENWKALHVVQKETTYSLDYDTPILTNQMKNSFIRRYIEKKQTRILTKSDLFRRIMELDIQTYIEVVGYEICENPRDYPLTEGMNWFVRDELFPIGSRKVLLLQFQTKDPGNYLNDSMVRFVISQLQMEISEYRCVGVII